MRWYKSLSDGDPIYVSPQRGSVLLRIGDIEQGKGRVAYLSPLQAEHVALGLIRYSREAQRRLAVFRLTCFNNKRQKKKHVCRDCRPRTVKDGSLMYVEGPTE